jgi:hypothetical protein
MFLGQPAKTLADARTPGEIIELLPVEKQLLYDIFNKDGWPSGKWDPTKFPTKNDFLLSKLTPLQFKILGGDAFFTKLETARNEAIAAQKKSKAKTYGDVMAQFSPEEKRAIDPKVWARLSEMRNLPFPDIPFDYHVDLVGLTPDGKNMFINESMQNNATLTDTLKFFRFNVVALPSSKVGEELTLSLNYMNAIQGRSPDGRPVILLPTEAIDPGKPTENDKKTIEIIQKTVPNTLIFLVGGASAVLGTGIINIENTLYLINKKDWGPSCAARPLPFRFTPISPPSASNVP